MAEIYITWGYYHHTGNQYRKYHNACKDSPALELITRKTVSGNRARAKLHYRRPAETALKHLTAYDKFSAEIFLGTHTTVGSYVSEKLLKELIIMYTNG